MRKLQWIPPLLLAAMGLAQAGEVWKCGNSYGQRPCAGGTRLDTAAAPASPRDAALASANARRDAALADRLEKARLAQEARAARAVIPPEPTAAASSPAKTPKKGSKDAKAKADRPFTAVSPR